MLLPLFGAFALSIAIIIMKSTLFFDQPPTCSFYMYILVGFIMTTTLFFNFQIPSFN